MAQIGLKPIREWGPGQPLDHRRLNDPLTRMITDLTVGPGLSMLRVGNSVSIGRTTDVQPQRPKIFLVRVVEDPTTTKPQILKVKFSGAANSTTRSNDTFNVVGMVGHGKDDVLYVFQPYEVDPQGGSVPLNGSGAAWLDNDSRPVFWREVGPAGMLWPCTLTVSSGSVGNATANLFYTVKVRDSTLKTGIAPDFRPFTGKIATAATRGLARFGREDNLDSAGSTGSLYLVHANEIFDNGGCSGT